MTKKSVVFVTSNQHKIEENRILVDNCTMADGTPVRDLFEFEIVHVNVLETLEVRLEIMVQAEVINAYGQIRRPCIVEHAGLIFDTYIADSYPGGLTKPMWNTLKDNFLVETQSAGRGAIARAVVAYCDGLSVTTFAGETHGRLTDMPRGSRSFYWDTIFVPDDPSGRSGGKTFAEIADDAKLGLAYKIVHLSQSTKAMLAFLEHRRKAGEPELWRARP